MKTWGYGNPEPGSCAKFKRRKGNCCCILYSTLWEQSIYLWVSSNSSEPPSCQKYTRLGFSECSSVKVLRNFYCMWNFVRGKLCMQITIDDWKAYCSLLRKRLIESLVMGAGKVCDRLSVCVCVWMLMCLQHGGKCVLPLPLGTTPYGKLKT